MSRGISLLVLLSPLLFGCRPAETASVEDAVYQKDPIPCPSGRQPAVIRTREKRSGEPDSIVDEYSGEVAGWVCLTSCPPDHTYILIDQPVCQPSCPKGYRQRYFHQRTQEVKHELQCRSEVYGRDRDLCIPETEETKSLEKNDAKFEACVAKKEKGREKMIRDNQQADMRRAQSSECLSGCTLLYQACIQQDRCEAMVGSGRMECAWNCKKNTYNICAASCR